MHAEFLFCQVPESFSCRQPAVRIPHFDYGIWHLVCKLDSCFKNEEHGGWSLHQLLHIVSVVLTVMQLSWKITSIDQVSHVFFDEPIKLCKKMNFLRPPLDAHPIAPAGRDCSLMCLFCLKGVLSFMILAGFGGRWSSSSPCSTCSAGSIPSALPLKLQPSTDCRGHRSKFVTVLSRAFIAKTSWHSANLINAHSLNIKQTEAQKA